MGAKKILAVDDNPMVQKAIKDLLTGHGYAVETASDGAGAMAKMREWHPDLVILDVMMPDMNGYDVCRAIRDDEALKHIPIILLTALAQEMQSRFLSSVGIEYVNKRCRNEELLAKIKELLGQP